MARFNVSLGRWSTQICRALSCAVLLTGACGGCGSGDRSVASSGAPLATDVPAKQAPAASAAGEDVAKKRPTSNPAADTALREACTRGDLQAARKAVDEGADANAADENGRTPLMWAAYDGHEAIVTTLLENKARINDRDSEGRTALMYCASGAFPTTVQLLLVNGAEVDLRDKAEGFTALMFAAAEGQAEVVKVLLSHNADRTLVDVDGDTAAAFARRAGHEQVVRMLEQ